MPHHSLATLRHHGRTWLAGFVTAMLLLPVHARADLVVLQYHHISEHTPPSTSTSPDLFRQQLDKIEELGLKVVPLDSGTSAALNGELENVQQIAISFDDAYETVWTEAIPELTQRALPFTIFVNTDAIGSPGYMTWPQLKQARDMDGVLIANHSHDHGHLARRPDERKSEWTRRVTASLDKAQQVLAEQLGTETPLFAYPYGEFDEALEEKIADRGWYGYGQQSGAIGAFSTATRMPRFPMATTFGAIGSLPEKLRSRAFPLETADLPAGVIRENPPTLSLNLPRSLDPGRLTCFATGQGRMVPDIRGQRVSITAEHPFSSRRFRYNCTYPLGDRQFYWLSQQWLDLGQPED